MATILVVEDNELIRELIARRLGRKGFVIIEAEDGNSGVTMARSSAPDLILMDVCLPDIDGIEATRLLKSDESTQRIPVIMLSASARDRLRRAPTGLECDEYETKPIDFARLTVKIESLLAEPSSPGESQEASRGAYG